VLVVDRLPVHCVLSTPSPPSTSSHGSALALDSLGLVGHLEPCQPSSSQRSKPLAMHSMLRAARAVEYRQPTKRLMTVTLHWTINLFGARRGRGRQLGVLAPYLFQRLMCVSLCRECVNRYVSSLCVSVDRSPFLTRP
jgi:hypothetical protein